MKQQQVKIEGLTLFGMAVRTNNKNEMDPDMSKICPLATSYWSNNMAAKFQHRTESGVTYCVYTDYESDEHGDYTFFIGEQVDSLQDQDLKNFTLLNIVPGSYEKLTTPAGKIPDVVIQAWQEIWQMDPTELGGERLYATDFEIHDKRAQDLNNAVVEIYLGIK